MDFRRANLFFQFGGGGVELLQRCHFLRRYCERTQGFSPVPRTQFFQNHAEEREPAVFRGGNNGLHRFVETCQSGGIHFLAGPPGGDQLQQSIAIQTFQSGGSATVERHGMQFRR